MLASDRSGVWNVDLDYERLLALPPSTRIGVASAHRAMLVRAMLDIGIVPYEDAFSANDNPTARRLIDIIDASDGSALRAIDQWYDRA